jgi:hypothetical protein
MTTGLGVTLTHIYAPCCTRGVVGRSPDGEVIYCTCADGLDAHMIHLSNLLQGYAATLEKLDAMREPLLGALNEMRQVVAEAFQQGKNEYDELEGRWVQVKLDEKEGDPPFNFFPDYADGEWVGR